MNRPAPRDRKDMMSAAGLHLGGPKALDQPTSVRLSRQRTRDTTPELALRRELFARGLRYRVHRRLLNDRSTVDIAFAGARVAVFVDGCFWHGCPSHGTSPKNNGAWWHEELAQNRARDQRANELLVAAGWGVIWVWEHEDPAEAADRIEAAVRARLG